MSAFTDIDAATAEHNTSWARDAGLLPSGVHPARKQRLVQWLNPFVTDGLGWADPPRDVCRLFEAMRQPRGGQKPATIAQIYASNASRERYGAPAIDLDKQSPLSRRQLRDFLIVLWPYLLTAYCFEADVSDPDIDPNEAEPAAIAQWNAAITRAVHGGEEDAPAAPAPQRQRLAGDVLQPAAAAAVPMSRAELIRLSNEIAGMELRLAEEQYTIKSLVLQRGRDQRALKKIQAVVDEQREELEEVKEWRKTGTVDVRGTTLARHQGVVDRHEFELRQLQQDIAARGIPEALKAARVVVKDSKKVLATLLARVPSDDVLVSIIASLGEKSDVFSSFADPFARILSITLDDLETPIATTLQVWTSFLPLAAYGKLVRINDANSARLDEIRAWRSTNSKIYWDIRSLSKQPNAFDAAVMARNASAWANRKQLLQEFDAAAKTLHDARAMALLPHRDPDKPAQSDDEIRAVVRAFYAAVLELDRFFDNESSIPPKPAVQSPGDRALVFPAIVEFERRYRRVVDERELIRHVQPKAEFERLLDLRDDFIERRYGPLWDQRKFVRSKTPEFYEEARRQVEQELAASDDRIIKHTLFVHTARRLYGEWLAAKSAIVDLRQRVGDIRSGMIRFGWRRTSRNEEAVDTLSRKIATLRASSITPAWKRFLKAADVYLMSLRSIDPLQKE